MVRGKVNARFSGVLFGINYQGGAVGGTGHQPPHSTGLACSPDYFLLKPKYSGN
jgi:hypothetical protein